jgi:hypothetical protein
MTFERGLYGKLVFPLPPYLDHVEARPGTIYIRLKAY